MVIFQRKIPEEVDKPLAPSLLVGVVVLPKPVVPEFITVHAGTPSNTSAPNYKVLYKDYIKNVASCEIYSTWPESTIRANIYAIISFTLNRIYIEWYKEKVKIMILQTQQHMIMLLIMEEIYMIA